LSQRPCPVPTTPGRDINSSVCVLSAFPAASVDIGISPARSSSTSFAQAKTTLPITVRPIKHTMILSIPQGVPAFKGLSIGDFFRLDRDQSGAPDPAPHSLKQIEMDRKASGFPPGELALSTRTRCSRLARSRVCARHPGTSLPQWPGSGSCLSPDYLRKEWPTRRLRRPWPPGWQWLLRV
jgi:hypothetical protein